MDSQVAPANSFYSRPAWFGLGIFSAVVLIVIPAAAFAAAGGKPAAPLRLLPAHDRQDHVLRHCRLSDGFDLGLRRYPLPRPWLILRLGRLLDGHVSHARDRRRRAVSQQLARLHGFSRLERVSLVLGRQRIFSLGAIENPAGARFVGVCVSAGLPFARASKASISRSSPRR